MAVIARYYPLLAIAGELLYHLDRNSMATWLDLDELAQHLKLPKSTLYKLVQRGDLPGHKVGRAWRFDRDEVDVWIKAGRKGPFSEKGINDNLRDDSKSAS
jgi:excisionase family DNA binding protein